MKDLIFYKKFLQIMAKGDALNWHERNSGNLTYSLTKEEVNEAKPAFNENSQVYKVDLELKVIAGDYLLATADGKFS